VLVYLANQQVPLSNECREGYIWFSSEQRSLAVMVRPGQIQESACEEILVGRSSW